MMIVVAFMIFTSQKNVESAHIARNKPQSRKYGLNTQLVASEDVQNILIGHLSFMEIKY